jgi:3-dehydroquinate dehydratase-1
VNPSPRIGTVALGGRPCIVAAGGEHEVDALVAADGADLVELRADLFDEPSVERVVASLARVRNGGRPIVLTVRSATEGGRAMPEERRRAIYEAGLPLADAIDVETASTALVGALVPAARRAGRTVMLSTHDFAATPPRTELLARVARAFEAGADVAKVATHAESIAALRVLIDVTRGVAPAPIATLAMGPAGPLSRFVLPAAGSLLTYASVGAPTAPGQMPVAELAALIARLFPA